MISRSQIECDVLIIGGGLAGCWAAIKAKEKAKRVVLVDKGKVSRCGKSAFAGAGILCPQPADDLDAWREEIVVRGQYLADQDMVDAILVEQPDRIREMGEWGVNYERDEKGDLVRVSGLGGVVSKAVTVSSQEMLEVLRRRLEGAGVKIVDRVYVTGLLTSDGGYPSRGTVVGCYGFNTRTGEPVVINAAATVLAAGGLADYHFTGDGIVMGYRAGAGVWGMELTRTMDKMSFQETFADLHLLTFTRLGMRLYNRLGERFMERYYPAQKENANRQQMALAVIAEYLSGRGPVYADLTHLDADSLNKLRTLPSTAPRVKGMERDGIDFVRDKLVFDVHSGLLHHETGGLWHGPYGETDLPGLYVAGENGGLLANGAGTVPIKLASCCVEGYRAGDSAAKYARETSAAPVSLDQVRFLEKETFEPLNRKSGLRVEELMDKVYEYLRPARVSIFRSDAPMRALLRELEDWRQAAGICKASDWHGLIKLHQKKSYLECIGFVFRSSLERRETRGMNIRADYPYRDDANWLKNVVLKRESDGERISYVPLPIDKYKVKPARLEKVPQRIKWE